MSVFIMKYVIASGWWSCPTEHDDREELFGSDSIRDVQFHSLWRKCIDSFTNAEEIVVIDSASPRRPENVEGEKWLSMIRNFGHSTNHSGRFSGYSRSIFLSMMYAYVNDFDYWVYIEQDALICGDNIIEESINKSKTGVIFGDGQGTPQQIQQSFMVFRKDKILGFLHEYFKINYDDRVISPEWKFLFCQNMLARMLPSSVLRWFVETSRFHKVNQLRNIAVRILRRFDQFDTFDFGYGRARPINFEDSMFYFQHGDSHELSLFERKLRKVSGSGAGPG